MCPNFQTQGTTFEFLDSNLPKNGFWGRNFRNLNLDSESASLRYYGHQYSDKTDNFDFLGPNLTKNGFWGQNFKKISLDSESASLRYYVSQFSDTRNNFDFWAHIYPKMDFGVGILKI